MSTPESAAAEPKSKKPKPKTRRGMNQSRGADGRFETDGRRLLDAAVRGEIGKRAPRKIIWIGNHIGAGEKLMSQIRSGKARPNLVQARALAALFPWIPIESWLTKDEAAKIFAVQEIGMRIALEPPPNPKTANRKKGASDPRQVTLDQVIAAKKAEEKAPLPALGDMEWEDEPEEATA